jgi:hypothetical protein
VQCRIRREFADGDDEVFVSLRDPVLPEPIETDADPATARTASCLKRRGSAAEWP